jgi:chemotaxis methyl-accepting protein methylase
MRGLPGNIPPMTEAERREISSFIETEFGIKMPAIKKSLLESRLGKRVAACRLPNYADYFDFVTKDPAGLDEYLHFMDLVSTHETSFFREIRHFDFLRGEILPALIGQSGRSSISVLCSACSTGEEAYSLGMLLDAGIQEVGLGGMGFCVEGLDLSEKAVTIARRGVYLAQRVEKVPVELRQRYVMANRDKTKHLCRIVPELRAKMRFHTGNLLGDLALDQRFYDVLFCRNVLIYFNSSNQYKVIKRLVDCMSADSFLFLGHSETMLTHSFPLKSVAHSVYQKK